MLVLSRQRGEAIMIGDETEITVVDIRGDKVRLGIRAPRTTAVHRKEVYDAIKNENKSAATMQPGDLPTGAPPPVPQNAPPSTSHMRLVKADHAAAPPVTPSDRAAMAPFLRAAIDEAKKGLAEGGLPIGAVLVRDGKVIAAGHNRRVQNGDPLAHAEMDCLARAGRQRNYKDTVLYSTLAPCFLCSGAVVHFGIHKVVVGESANFPGGGQEFLRQHGVEVVDLHDPECIDMVGAFKRDHPGVWEEGDDVQRKT